MLPTLAFAPPSPGTAGVPPAFERRAGETPAVPGRVGAWFRTNEPIVTGHGP
jgi:hypothetical protein